MIFLKTSGCASCMRTDHTNSTAAGYDVLMKLSKGQRWMVGIEMEL